MNLFFIKNIVIASCIALATGCSNDFDTKYEKLLDKFRSGDYQGTITDAESLLPQVLELNGKDSDQAVLLYIMLGNLESRLKNYNGAGRYYKQVIETLGIEDLRQDPPKIVLCYRTASNYGRMLLNKGEYDESIRYFNYALSLVKANKKFKLTQFVEVSQSLAEVYIKLSNYVKAENYLNKLLSLSNKAYGRGNIKTMRIQALLAKTYSMQNRFDKANKLFEEVLLNLPDRDSTLFLLRAGKNYERQKRYSQALSTYKAALNQAITEYGEQDLSVADIYESIASVLDKQGKVDEAIVFYDMSLGISRKVLGASHPDLLSALNNKALCLQLDKRFSKAEMVYKEVEKVIESNKIMDKSILELGNYASLYFDQKQYNKCEAILTTALQHAGGIYSTKVQHINLLRKFIMLYETTGENDQLPFYFERVKVLINLAQSNGNTEYDELMEEVHIYYNR